MLVTSIGQFGDRKFYNAQEIGLAKALDRLCEEVKVYRLVDANCESSGEWLEGCRNTFIQFIPSKRVGSNGLPDITILDRTLDALVFFSDMQFSVPAVYRWARRNGVKLIPYIGVIESHSTNSLKRSIMDLLFSRNLAVYKKHHCAVKTPAVQAGLEKLGVSAITVTPVGLDLSVLKTDFMDADELALKQKYAYCADDKVILFIGRLTEEKQPLRMIELFEQLYHRNRSYKLLIVGNGELCQTVTEDVEKRELTSVVQIIERISNKDIWELYRFADCFVNLNQQEIFGMAILEAMYYGCKVVAWKAPGPSFIIEDGISGCLADSDEGILTAITEKSIMPEASQRRILDNFTWDKTAQKLLSIAESK